MRRLLVLPLLLLALVSCGGDDDDDGAAAASTTTTAAPPPGTTLHADGFVVDGAEVRFPAEKDAVVAALTEVLGPPTSDAPDEEPCPSGDSDSTVLWEDGGLALRVAGTEVVGWDLRPDAQIGLDTSIGVGSSRLELEAAYGPPVIVEETTLEGVEFYYETVALDGLLDRDAPDGTITALWAGSSCIFR